MDTLVLGCILPTTKANWELSPVRNVRRKAHNKKAPDALNLDLPVLFHRRSDVIRTRDLCVPNAALYQTEPRFDLALYSHSIIQNIKKNVNGFFENYVFSKWP